MRKGSALATIALAALGCSSEAPTLVVDVVTGHETDTFTQAPSVTRVDVVATALDGSGSTSASAAPGGTFDLGELPDEVPISIAVTGVDATGATVVRGASFPFAPAAVTSPEIAVFAQRVGAWARPPEALPQAHVHAPAVALGERFLYTSGGDSAKGASGDVDARTPAIYNLVTLAPATSDSLRRVARSMLLRGTSGLVIGDDGADLVDFVGNTQTTLDPPPDGLTSFGDVAGGAAVEGTDGRAFIVGATRTSGATAAVLVVSSTGGLSVATLATPRVGAAAAWVDTVGLVVAGGAADGAGVEVLAIGATEFVERGFPADAVAGAGAYATGDGGLALVGGVDAAGDPAPTRRIDPKCKASCAPVEIAGASIPAALTRVSAYATATGGRGVAVGEEVAQDGLDRCFVIDLGAGTATEILLREPRRGATPVPTPLGALGLVGGEHADGSPATTIETWLPD